MHPEPFNPGNKCPGITSGRNIELFSGKRQTLPVQNRYSPGAALQPLALAASSMIFSMASSGHSGLSEQVKPQPFPSLSLSRGIRVGESDEVFVGGGPPWCSATAAAAAKAA